MNLHSNPISFSITFAICFLLIKPCFSLGGKNTLEGLLKDESFRKEVTKYSQEMYRSPNGVGIPYLEICYDSLRQPNAVLLYAFAFLSQIEKNLPTNYVYFENRLMLVYDETAIPLEKNQWFLKLKSLVGDRLCDNVSKPKKVGDVEMIPCIFIYDPPGWFLEIQAGKLMGKEQIF